MADQRDDAAAKRVRKTLRFHSDSIERAKYWADRRGYEDENDYIVTALEEKIARENGDYNVPALNQQRLNQIVDELKALSVNVQNLETVTITGFDTVTGLARGDSYLLDEESGELDVPDQLAGTVGA